MIGFLTGFLGAIVLAGATYLALDEFAVTSIERINNPSLILDDVDHQYSPIAETNPGGIARE